MAEGFGTEPATLAQKLIFGSVALAMTLLFLGAVAQAARPIVPIPGFMPAFLAVVFVTDLVTASLLFVHAPLARRPDLSWLAAAYLFSGGIACVQFLVFPGIVKDTGLFGAGPQTAVWLWVFWHAGFPGLFAIAFLRRLWLERRARAGLRDQAPRPTMHAEHGLLLGLFVLLAVVALGILVTRFQDLLPPLITGRAYGHLANTAIGKTVILINLATAALVLFASRGRSLLDLGLCVTILAATFDVAFTLAAGARYSLGWYLGRGFSASCALPILTIYLVELTWLYARVTRLNMQLAEQARFDVTTGIYNRRYFNITLSEALSAAATKHRTLALLLIDVDHFKRYNDAMGHLAGDRCLHQIAQAVQAALTEEGEFVARYGGEEFGVVLPAADTQIVTARAESILRIVRALALPHPDSPTGSWVTVSIGAGLAWPGARFADLVNAADTSLYTAKGSGRSRCGPALTATQAPGAGATGSLP
ncbi:GGDEF domain-containing protein [Acidisoma sp. 7E03]